MAIRAWLLVAVCLSLAACGGGGGGGGNNGGGGGRGGFTLNTTSVTLLGKVQTPPPPAQQVQVHLNDTASAAIAAGYRPGVTPATWLQVSGSGSNRDYMFSLSLDSSATTMPLGTYTTTLTFVTTDSSGNPLQDRDLQVTFTLRDGLRIVVGSVNGFATAGRPPTTQAIPFEVIGLPGINWTATSNVPWVIPPAGTQSGAGTFMVSFDNTGLAANFYNGKVTLTNTADPTDTAELQVLFSIQQPFLSLDNAAPNRIGTIFLGGTSGLQTQPNPARLTLGTGTNAFPWTLTTSTTSGGNWLRANVTSGVVSETSPAFIEIDADRSSLSRGTYQGEVRATANVYGGISFASIPVILNVEDDRLVVDTIGIGFSSFPSRNVLQRTLRVGDSWGVSTVPWQATSDQSWLGVTPSGNTSAGLTLTANPSGLAPGQYFANVTISSNDARIVNQETVRVGFTVRSSDAAPSFTLASEWSGHIAVNPVEPEVWIINPDGETVSAYDIYSPGAALRTIDVPNAVGLVMSGDGRSLYVLRNSVNTVLVHDFDPATGIMRTTYDANTTTVNSIRYARPDAHPVLLSNGRTLDLLQLGGTIGDGFVVSSPFAISRDQLVAYTRDTARQTIYAWGIRYSELANPKLVLELHGTNNGQVPGDTRDDVDDLALSSGDDKLYVASGNPGQFDVLDPATLLFSSSLPAVQFANNVETSWNGLVAAGRWAAGPGTDDIWIYDAAGTPKGTFDSGDGSLWPDALKFSGDGTRLISASSDGLRIQAAPAP